MDTIRSSASPQHGQEQPDQAQEGIQSLEWVPLVLALMWISALHLMEWPAPLYPSIVSSSSIDAAFYAFAGELLRTGGAPYLSYWDHKPPLIHVLNAAALTVSRGAVWGIWALSVATLWSAAMLAYCAMRWAFGWRPAVLGLVFFAISLPAILAFNMTEEYILPLQWVAVLLFLAQDSFEGHEHWLGTFLGALGATAFLLRPNLIGAVVSVTLILGAVLLARRRYRAGLRFTGGGLLGAGLIALSVAMYLWRHGALAAFADQVFYYNAIYTATSWSARVSSAAYGLVVASPYGVLALPVAGWLFASLSLTHTKRPHVFSSVLLLSVVWLPIEVLLAAVSGRQYGHYFMPLFSPLAFLAAGFATALTSAPPERLSQRLPCRSYGVLASLALTLAVFPLGHLLLEWRDHGAYPKRMEQIAPTVDYIREHTSPEASILVWGHAADLYLFSERAPATRFIYPLPLLTPGYATADLIDSFLQEVRSSSPALIIDASVNQDARDRLRKKRQDRMGAGEDLVPPLEPWDPAWHYPRSASFIGPSRFYWAMTPSLKSFYDFAAQHYRLVERVGPQGWGIYKRTSSSPELAGEALFRTTSRPFCKESEYHCSDVGGGPARPPLTSGQDLH